MRLPFVLCIALLAPAARAQLTLLPDGGPPDGEAQAVLPLSAADVLLVQDRRLFATHDAGATWREPLPMRSVRAPWRGFDGTVYATVRTEDGSEIGYVSSDSGRTWTRRMPAADERRRQQAVRSPRDGWFVIEDGTVLRSIDEGGTWANVTGVLRNQYDNRPSVVQTNGEGDVFAMTSTNWYGYGSTLFVWDPAALRWATRTTLLGSPSAFVFGVGGTGLVVSQDSYIDSSSPIGQPRTLFATRDAGRTWHVVSGGSGGPLSDTLLATHATAGPDGTLYLSTRAGVLATRDGARTFERYGLDGPRAGRLIAGPDGALYTTSGGDGYEPARHGAFRRAAGAPAWSAFRPETPTSFVTALAPLRDGLAAATAQGVWTRRADGRWRRADAVSVTQREDYLEDRGIPTALVEAPWGTFYLARSPSAVVTKQEASGPGQRLVALGDSVLLWHSAYSSYGIIRSVNRGRTWTRVDSVYAIDLLVLPGGRVLAAGGTPDRRPALWSSADEGATWQRLLFPSASGGPILSVAARAGSAVLYAAQYNVLHRSTDGGGSWEVLPGIPPSGTVGTAGLAAPRLGWLVASMRHRGGLHLSTDEGATWAKIAAFADVYQLRAVPDFSHPFLFDADDHLVTVSPDGGLLRSASPVAAESAAVPPSALSLVAGPNPFRGALSATLALPAPAHVRADVFDALGRRVATIHDGMAAAGTLALRWNATGVAPGVYVLRVAAGAEAVTARVVRLR